MMVEFLGHLVSTLADLFWFNEKKKKTTHHNKP